MKKFKISVLALAALALGACTSDDVVVNTPVTNVAEAGENYVCFAINLPSQASTRANDVFEDGLESEYAVNDATLLLFSGDSEAAAVCYAAYTLQPSFSTDDTSGNITSRQKFVQQITKPVSDNLYALVVLNDNGMGTRLGGYVGKSLYSLQTESVTLNGVSDLISNGFYMTNSPLITAPGGVVAPADDATVTILSYIDPDHIYSSEAEADANPASEIYVERGMAKVTMSVEDSYTIDDLDVVVTIDGFALDQTNNVMYPVRDTYTESNDADQSWWTLTSAALDAVDYRFAGSTVVGSTLTDDASTTILYRTYWAQDPNYDDYPYSVDANGNKVYDKGMTSIIGSDIDFTAIVDGDGDANPLYCLENTFDVAHQNQDETTRAIIRANLAGLDDFYTWDGNKTILYTEDEVKALVIDVFSANPTVDMAVNEYIGGGDFYENHVSVSFEETSATDDATAVIAVTGLENDMFSDGAIPDVFTSGLQEVVDELNASHTIGYYEDGECYYAVLIKHFGDDQAPWDLDTVTGSTTATDPYNTSYPTNAYGSDDTPEQNWLGRYGVLRNNWYDIYIGSISMLGSAVPPTATGEPDDPTETWLAVRINILAWALRTQRADL